MTEKKRFEKTKSDIKTFRIYDYEKEDAYFLDCDNHTVECLVDLLNEQHEENEQLKQEKDYYKRELQKELVCQAIIDGREKND